MSYAESRERLVAEPGAYQQLESGFRRLLGRYPAAYRRAREQEMLATLMESSAPGQRRPGLRDQLDLAMGAVRAHLKLTVRPAITDALSAVALPAAILLAMHLCQEVFGQVTIVLAGHWPQPSVWVDEGSTVAYTAAASVYWATLLAGLALAVALVARKPVLVHRLAVILLPVLAFRPAIEGWHVTGLIYPGALGPALLAALVAAAPRTAFTPPRTRLALLGLAGFAVPMVGMLIEHIVASRQMATAGPMESTPMVIMEIPDFAVIAGLVLTAALTVRWHGGRGLLASVLLVGTMLPELGMHVIQPSWGQWDHARIPVDIVVVSLVFGTIVIAELHRRATSRTAAPSRPATA